MSILEDEDLEVLWLKIMPKRSPRKISCVLLACIYFTQDTDFLRMRDHLITGLDKTLRKHPDCGILITGDSNQLNDTFLRTHYRLVQVVTTSTRGVAILDKIWTNMADVYCTAVTISELGSSDHNMALLRPIDNTSSTDKGHVIRVTKRSMGQREKEEFANALSLIRWEPLYRLTSCEDMYIYYHTIIITLMNMCFPAKVVTRHTADKPWVTDEFRSLVRSRQRTHMRGDTIQEHFLRNRVIRTATRLKYVFYQSKITAIKESGSRNWWKHMKLLMGLYSSSRSDMQGLANKTDNGDFDLLANRINDFFVSVSEHLPRLNVDDPTFEGIGELPDQYVINVETTREALLRVAYVVPLPKAHPPVLIEKDTPYFANVNNGKGIRINCIKMVR